MEGIQCESTSHNGWGIFSLQGRLDRVNSEEVAAKGNAELEQHTKMAVNLEKLDYISSAGIRVLLRLAKKAKAEGKDYVLCGPHGFVKEVLEDSNLDVLVPIAESVEKLL